MKTAYGLALLFLSLNSAYADMKCENSNGESVKVWKGADEVMRFQADIEIDTGFIPGLPQYPQTYTVSGSITCVASPADPFLLDCEQNSAVNIPNLTLIGDSDHKIYLLSSQVSLQSSYSTVKSIIGQQIETVSQRVIELDLLYFDPANPEKYLTRNIAIPNSSQGYVSGSCSFN